jgi:hypothetical protein
MNQLTLDDLLTSSGRYKDRAKSKELTPDMLKDGRELVRRVNGLLDDLEWEGDRDATSGFRTSAANSSIGNAAKKSLHMRCMAIDLLDDAQQELANAILARPDLLKKWGLWLEHPDCTRGERTNWAHLDMSLDRKDRAVRVFRA